MTALVTRVQLCNFSFLVSLQFSIRIKSRPGVHDNSVLQSQHDLIIQGYAYAVYQHKTLTVGDVTWVR